MKNYCVYEHVFPNGKKYIGITCTATDKRWRGGKGYETQPKMYKAIKKYGWENVQHKIIADELSKEEAEQLEHDLIADFKTIDNGYNATIGGDRVNGYYLDAYILKMLIAVKRQNYDYDEYLINFMDEGKTDKTRADLINEASRAVTIKYGKFRTTSPWHVAKYFFCMQQYFVLNTMIANGQDVSDWTEISPEQALYDYVMK